MTGPSVEDVIAEAVCSSHTDAYPDGVQCAACRVAAAAVVAAIRAMTVAQQAELIGGFVAVKMAGGAAVIAVGPWREEP